MRNLRGIILLAGLFIISCTNRQETKEGQHYATDVSYVDEFEYHNPEREQKRTSRLCDPDTLYIFFETEFESDTVTIEINGQDSRTLYLKTDPSLGLAGMVQYGDINSIESVDIRMNNGSPLTFNLTDKTMNLWAVMYYADTLRGERRKYLSWYE